MAERLRARKVQSYNLGDSDDDDLLVRKSKTTQENPHKIARDDAKDDSCQACKEGGDLMSCGTCSYAYHLKCLLQPLRSPPTDSWSCPECVNPLNEIDKILDCEMRPTAVDGDEASKQISVMTYLVKWRGISYLHCTWVPEKEFVEAFNSYPRLKTKLNKFHRDMESKKYSEDDFVAIRPEWTTVDRILACRGDDDEKEYLVKYKELPYDECYWELKTDIFAFQHEIERYHEIKSRPRRLTSSKQKNRQRDADKSKKKKYDQNPEFLSGGSLHPYQLEGLNFLRFSWSKQTHVILADEMGLGKTIQSIAFLASLFEDNISPHLVVAPLSTLRNWEREFATWAPQMNVVMFVGSSQARAVIREHEFHFPKSSKKRRNRAGQIITESKNDRIKFDVLLTSYEMINLDMSLKSIKWECMIVDEGHRLKNKDSKLFVTLKQYLIEQRVLLTGTPLQNNLDELFMLMHFLDAGKFDSLEAFQEEFEDINQEEQILRLHKMLAPHLLRRIKKDVMKELPPKKELILRVELSSKQKEYYKAILTRNYEVLTQQGGAQVSLVNVVMELRKLCCHPFMLEGVQPEIEDSDEAFKQLVESCGKLQLLDKMMVKLKQQGHRVLIYSQFQHMLDLLEVYCTYKKWQYERIDGKVGGTERQIRIDRFNAKNSSRFCFLLSTRAGGIGINLATADTVIIYDSDWNPHADLQAMARAHRLGQTNKVMIYRLVNRGTIEERMMQMTKKKMVLEHLVVGRLKAQNVKQEELNDIIRYGSKELFTDENDEAMKSRQIHYDDAAVDRLLDREKVEDQETSVEDQEDGGFLKAFKVANFEYVDESAVTVQEEEQLDASKSKTLMSESDSLTYWQEIIKDKPEVQTKSEASPLGKRKRTRKQVKSLNEDNLAGLRDLSSDEAEDNNYETGPADENSDSSGAAMKKRTITHSTKRDREEKFQDRTEAKEVPLMEGEGKGLKVMGFNRSQRLSFAKIIMRFGVDEWDWKDFVSRIKRKNLEEIRAYARHFLQHLIEEDNEASNYFQDGVPKEGLRKDEILLRISYLVLVREKMAYVLENPEAPLFQDHVFVQYPDLKSGEIWKKGHDIELLRALLKHGYGRWQNIADDDELPIQEAICQLLNLPFPGHPIPQEQNSVNSISLDMQKRKAEYVKKRLALLEKGLKDEYLRQATAALGNVENNTDSSTMNADEESARQIPLKPIGPEEMSAAVFDNNPERVDVAELYNELCKMSGANAGSREDIGTVHNICQKMGELLQSDSSKKR
ncbi:hypothetical protein ACFE04_014159 [Oxalis oulophora]